MEEVGKDQAMVAGIVEVDQIMDDKGRLHLLRLRVLLNLGEKVLVEVGPSLKVCIIMEKVSIRVHFQVCIFLNVERLYLGRILDILG